MDLSYHKISMQEGSLETSDIEPLISERKSPYSKVKTQNHPAKNEETNLGLPTVHSLLPVHSLQKGKSKAAPPPHCGSLSAEQQSSVQGDTLVSGRPYSRCGCPAPSAICLLNLCSRILRPHLELLLQEKAERIWVLTPSTKQG